MKKASNIIYTIISSIVYIFAVTFFIYNLYNEYSAGTKRIQRRFAHISNSFQQLNTADKNDISKNASRIIGNHNDFSYFELTVDDELVYSYNLNNKNSSSRLILNKNTEYEYAGSNIKISADLYTIRPSVIFYSAKISFLIVLIITIITLIIILYDNSHVLSVSTEETDKSDEEEEIEEPVIANNETTDNASEMQEEETSEETYVDIPETYTEQETISFEEPELETEEAKEESNYKKVSLPTEELQPMHLKTEEYDGNPAGLFSPLTGFGWESYLLTRLDSELTRAISSELDLSLFVIRFPNLDQTHESIPQICDYLLSQFQFRDLLFEYKEDCFAAIKINCTIDEAIILADKIHSEIKDYLQDENCFIGISSKTIRMITGETLLFEATKAEEMAERDSDNPIVAFRADAEKFRNFINNN